MSREKEMRADIKDLKSAVPVLSERLSELENRFHGHVVVGVEDAERVANLEKRLMNLSSSVSDMHGTLRKELEEFVVGRQWAVALRDGVDLGVLSKQVDRMSDVVTDLAAQVLALQTQEPDSPKKEGPVTLPTWKTLIATLRDVATRIDAMAERPETGDRFNDGLKAAAAVLRSEAYNIERNHP